MNKKERAWQKDEAKLNSLKDIEVGQNKDQYCNKHGKMNNLPQTSFGQLQLFQALQTSSSLDERERSLQ